MLILRSEDLFYDLFGVYDKVLEFLQLPKHRIDHPIYYNLGDYPPINPVLRRRMVHFFKPHNKALYKYLAWDSVWD